jgi:hypothetical protein
MRWLPLLLLAACPLPTDDKSPEDTTGETDGPAPIDLVLLVDNSSSMDEESVQIGAHAEEIVAALVATGDDWQLGVTSVTTDPTAGDEGVAGDPYGEPIALGEDGAADALRERLWCEATCWNTVEIPSAPDYACGDDPAVLSREFLDCLCGEGVWQDNCGSGDEQGLEAALLAACRAVETPTDACYGYVVDGGATEVPTVIAGAEGTNAGLLRGGAVRYVILSDEGDSSRRTPTGDSDVTPWVDAFDGLGLPWRFSVYGPAWDGENGDCLEGAQPWAVERYQQMVAARSGVYQPIADLDADCAATDVVEFFDDVADL